MFPASVASRIHVTEPDEEAKQAGIDRADTEVIKLSMQISLHDRDDDRRTIRALLGRAVMSHHRDIDGVFSIAKATGQLRDLANKLDPVEPGKLGELADKRIEAFVKARSESDLKGIVSKDVQQIRNAAVHIAQLAIRASIAASEVALGAPVHGRNVNDEIDGTGH